MTQLDRLEALAEKKYPADGFSNLDPYHGELWVCPDCAFSFDAAHVNLDADGSYSSYSCPNCFQHVVEPLLPDLIRVARAAKHVSDEAWATRQTVGIADADLRSLDDALAPFYREVEA